MLAPSHTGTKRYSLGVNTPKLMSNAGALTTATCFNSGSRNILGSRLCSYTHPKKENSNFQSFTAILFRIELR